MVFNRFLKVQFAIAFVIVCLSVDLSIADDNGSSVYKGPASKRLLNKIFNEDKYNPFAFPDPYGMVSGNETEIYNLSVAVRFELTELVDLDLKNEVFRANLWITCYWIDIQLMWEPDDYDGLQHIVLPAEKIWSPKLILKNSVTGINDKVLYSDVTVDNEGYVTWTRTGQFSSSCEVNVAWFPFDEQTCEMTFMSWDDSTDVQLTSASDDSSVKESVLDGEWRIVEMTTNASSQVRIKDYTFQTAVFTVRAQRLPQYYIFNIIVPCAMISILALVAFVLPPGSSDKINLTITVLLTLAVFMLLVADYIPPSPQAIPIIDIYLIILMALSTASVVASVFIISIHDRAYYDIYEVPNWVRIAFCEWLAWLMFIKKRTNKKKQDLDRLDQQTEEVCAILNTPTFPANNAANHQLAAILIELRCITRKMQTDARGSEREDEWKIVAMVVDRFCLLLLAVLFIIATTVVFTIIPVNS